MHPGSPLGLAGSLPGLRVSQNSRPDCPLLIGPNIPLGYPLGCENTSFPTVTRPFLWYKDITVPFPRKIHLEKPVRLR